MKMLRVVNILTGEQRDAGITEEDSFVLWWPEHITKKGEAPGNRSADGWFFSRKQVDDRPYFTWALYDKQREEEAGRLRARVAVIQAALRVEQAALFDLYAAKEQETP